MFVIINYIDFRYYGLGILLVQLIHVIAMNIFLVRKHFPFIEVKKSLQYVGLSTVLCALISFTTSLVLPMDDIHGILQQLSVLITYSIVVMGSFLLVGFFTFNRDTITQIISYIDQLIPKVTRRRIEHANKSS